MNISKGKLILLLAIPLAMALVWGIITTNRLSASRTTLQQTQATLTQTQTELASARQQVADLQAELKTTQDNLTQTKSTLAQTQTQLNSTTLDLNNTKLDLNNTKLDLSNTKLDLSNTQNQLSTAQSQLSSANTELTSVKSQLADTQAQLASSMQQLTDYKKTMQALGIAVHSSTTTWTFNGLTWTHTDNSQAVNPTWNQMITFIAQDKTDQHPYDIKSFNCVNYATTVYNNAERLNIETATVTLNLRNSSVGHAVNAFITSDYGLVYVDCTTSDTIARVETGKVYRAVALGTIQPTQVRNDAWWDALTGNYYYLPGNSGGQAIVDSIDIYW
jgi:myosin heavy subunit